MCFGTIETEIIPCNIPKIIGIKYGKKQIIEMRKEKNKEREQSIQKKIRLKK